MYGVPPEGTATKVHEQGEIVLNCNVGMYMLNVIGGGGCGGEEKGLSCKRGWYDKLEGERVIPVKMWEGGRSKLGLLIHKVHQTKQADGRML